MRYILSEPIYRRIEARLVADAVLFGLVFFAPWWAFLLFACAGMAYFDDYAEAFAAALLFDLLYGFSSARLYGFGLYFSLFVLAFFAISSPIKKTLRYR